MPTYREKKWTKRGNAAQSNEQLNELSKIILEFPSDSVTAHLEEEGKPVIVVIEGESKARKITVKGTVSEVDKPKVEEPDAEPATA